MNWLERARREFSENAPRPTAVTAERNPTAVTAVLCPARQEEPAASNGSNGSARPARILDSEVRWRVEAMFPQVPTWPAPVFSLLARPDINLRVDNCLSCGDPLEPMGLAPVPRRCHPCRWAAWLVLEDRPLAGRA